MASSASGWSEVPSDILWLIIKRLLIADYVRFGAVCRSWHAALAEKLCPPAPQVPWLLISNTESQFENNKHIKFLSLSENNKEYHIDLPPEYDHGHIWIGSSNGWLISVDEAWDVHMFDPISRSHARLRSAIADFPDITPELLSVYGAETIRTYYFTKIVVQSPSSSNNKLVVAAISYYSNKLIIVAERHESRWSWATVPAGNDDFNIFSDIIFCRDQLFAISWSGWGVACDVSDPSRPKVSFSVRAPSNRSHEFYYSKSLVESLSGDLLYVTLEMRNGELDWYSTSAYVVRVFKMDPTGGSKKKWVELKNIGDQAIFLDYNQSLILSTQDFPELKRNCAYLTNSNWEKINASPVYNRYNMEDGTFTQHELLVDNLSLWFAPTFEF